MSNLQILNWTINTPAGSDGIYATTYQNQQTFGKIVSLEIGSPNNSSNIGSLMIFASGNPNLLLFEYRAVPPGRSVIYPRVQVSNSAGQAQNNSSGNIWTQISLYGEVLALTGSNMHSGTNVSVVLKVE